MHSEKRRLAVTRVCDSGLGRGTAVAWKALTPPRSLAQRSSLAALFLAIAACGGGGGGGSGGGGPPPTNTAPTAQALNFSFDEDVGGTGALQGQDADGDTLTYRISANPSAGTVALTSGPNFTYRPNPNFFGTDQFSYTVSDGKATSAAAAVTIQIRSVNDAPTLSIVAAPSESRARATFEIRFQASDIDGNVTDVQLSQLSGTSIAGSTRAADVFSVIAPNPSVVDRLSLRVTASDNEGGTSSQDVFVNVLPVSASGRLITVIGGLALPGSHWVVTGDGYTAAELGKLFADARNAGLYVLETPPTEAYKPASNLHVLEAVSNQSGMDVPSESIYRDTAFDATADCQGISRLVCVNAVRVQNAVIAEVAAFDEIAVIVNSDRYGGSGGAIAVATSTPSARDVLLHEFGHSFAGLADEYVDEANAQFYLPFYREDRLPNVTRVADLATVKWRHWFADPANVPRTEGQPGVGLFEGAYYHAAGFFRPTSDSFMRTLSRTMGEVNAEAWLLATYRSAGATYSSSPSDGSITATAGSNLQFAVRPSIGPPVQRITWLLNGVELPGSRDQTDISCCGSLIGTHAVSVIVQDVTGNIRKPGAAESVFQRSWSISIQ
jgi:hypothetical protein